MTSGAAVALMAAVMQGHSQLAPADAAAALGWLVAAGVDTPVEATPRNWLMPAPRPDTRPAEVRPVDVTRTPAAQFAARPARPAAVPASVDSATLDALVASLNDFAHPLRRADIAPQLITGDANAGILVICEQPEAEGSPVAVLRARMLAAIGLDAGNSALLNRLPWPTTGARTPRADEIAAFAPFVDRALELAAPRVLLALGQVAAALAGEPMAVSSARGRWADVAVGGRAVPLLATCNPRYLLTQPLRKREAWADLQAFAARMTSTA